VAIWHSDNIIDRINVGDHSRVYYDTVIHKPACQANSPSARREISASQGVMAPLCIWEGNRRSGVAHAMHQTVVFPCRLNWL